MNNKPLIFGGSFDPPHRGHVTLVQRAIRDGYGPVIILPSYGTFFKGPSQGTPTERLEMARLAFLVEPEDPRVIVSDIEIRHGKGMYMIEGILKIKEEYQITAPVGLLIGEDLLKDFTRWYKWEDVLKETFLVVAPRSESFQISEGSYPFPFLYLPGEPLEVASREIREIRRNFGDIYQMIPQKVLDYIEKKSLYQ